MPKLSRHHLTLAAATAAAAAGGTAAAGAADNNSSSSASSGTSAQQRPADRGGPAETPLTGTTKDQVQKAALARVDGTVLRVETDAGGVYEAHIRKADGTVVEVKVNGSFDVTAVDTEPAGGRGPGGHGHGPGDRANLAAVARKLGVTQAKLQSALQAARPSGDPRGHGDDAAAIADALGVDTAEVQSILDANRPQPGANGGRHGVGPRDDSGLVSALAKGLNKSRSDVQAAVDKAQQAERADHEARETAMYAAVAKALGKDTADVKAAFQAARAGG